MTFTKALELAALLDGHKPHQIPGHANRPPLKGATSRRKIVHPLESMFRRKIISDELYVAGLRFRADYELAGVSGEATIDWDRMSPVVMDELVDELAWRKPAPKPIRKPPSGIPVARYDAKQTLVKLRVVCGSLGWQLMRGVCVMGIPLQFIAVETRMHRDFVSLRLREALADAAAFYGNIIDGNDNG